MTTDDWNDDGNRTVGMFLAGDPLRYPGPRGEQVRDRSFLIWLNGGPDDVKLTLPENEWVRQGEVVLSTNAEVEVGTVVGVGTQVVLQGRSVMVLRQS
jgi:glycogen operon protein